MNKKEIEINKSIKYLENIKEKLSKKTYNKFKEDLNIKTSRIDKYINIYKKLDDLNRLNLNSLMKLNNHKKEEKMMLEKIKNEKNIVLEKKQKNFNKIIDDLNDKQNLKKEAKILSSKNIKYDLNNLKNLLSKIDYDNKNIFLNVNNNYYPIKKNNNLYNNIDKILNNNIDNQINFNSSDYQIIKSITNMNEINITSYDKDYYKQSRKHKKGAFFNMFINDEYNNINLSKYQIFNKDNINNYVVKKKENDELKFSRDIFILEECLIKSLKEHNILSEEKIQYIKIKFFSRFPDINLTNIKLLCEEMKFNIRISYLRNDLKDEIKFFIGDEENKNVFFNIGLINEHFFINDETIYTNYYIKNIDDLKNIDDDNKYNIYKSQKINNKIYYKYDKDNKFKMSSYELIKYFFINKDKFLYYIDYENSNNIKYSNNVKDIINNDFITLDYDIEKNTKDFKKKIINEKKNKYIIYADTETYLDINNKHIPYIINFTTQDNENIYTIDSNECIKWGFFKLNKYLYEKFNDEIKNYEFIIYFHNMNYDIRFIYDHLYNKNMILKDNRILSHKAISFYNKNMINYTFKDSYLLIPEKLAKFNNMFKLGEINKEIIPYKLYNSENVNKRYMNINFVLENYINKDDKEHFINNIIKWNCYNKYNNDEYDILKYSYEYCLIDCIVLKKGLEVFNSWFINDENKNINSIDIHNYLTLPSIAYEILINFGCFDNVKLLSGVPSLFISKSVVGGRTMTMNNNKIKLEYDKVNKKYIEEHIINNKINSKVGIENYIKKKDKYIKKYNEKKYIVDFDAVSLYPSSMFSLDGFPIGVPKILKNNELNINFLNSIDYYYIEIQILNVNKNLSFPLQPYIFEKEGSKQYINDLINKKFIVDKITLEELIKYQKIEFNIVRGYYFNEGFNTKIKDCIKFLFNKRIELKKVKNCAEVLYKLIMNSSYGKTILKPIMKDTKLFNNENDLDKYIESNFEYIDRIIKISNDNNKSIVITHKHINNHFNCPQVGTMILSNSKRIMNKIFNIAENNNINIFYQDTDSMHIYEDDLNQLINIYEKNNGKLVGDYMLEFHSDFKLEGAKYDIKATKSIFLGKKCYIDRLVGYDIDKNKIKGYHMRMKGVSEAAILDLVDKFNSNKKKYIDKRKELSKKYNDLKYLNNDNYKVNPFDLYKILYNNEILKFDLLASGEKVSFDVKLNGDVHNRIKFKREIKFNNGEQLIID